MREQHLYGRGQELLVAGECLSWYVRVISRVKKPSRFVYQSLRRRVGREGLERLKAELSAMAPIMSPAMIFGHGRM